LEVIKEWVRRRERRKEKEREKRGKLVLNTCLNLMA